MRLWSINPKYLDSKGLVALWRETLLAQNVLLNKTKGYKNHPQLERFKVHEHSIALMATYLYTIYDESLVRGYNFDKSKIVTQAISDKISVTRGQVEYEFEHLLKKLQQRDIKRYESIKGLKVIELNPIFYEIDGVIESWEVVQ